MLTFLRSRLSVRLTLSFLLASLVPVLGGGWLARSALERSTRRDAIERQRLIAEAGAALVTETLERAEEKLTTMSRLLGGELASWSGGEEHGTAALTEFVVERLRSQVEPADVFLELQYFGSASADGVNPLIGQVQQRVLQEFQQTEIPDVAARNEALSEELAQSLVVQEPLLGNAFNARSLEHYDGYPTLRLSRPVAEPGKKNGALVGFLAFEDLEARLAGLVGRGFQLVVTDANGTQLARVGAVSEPSAGETVIGADDWRVTVVEPAARVTEPLALQRRQVLSWTALAVGLSLLLSFIVSAWITRPVAALRRAAEAMERGDLKTRSGIARADEVGALANAFDRMAASLDQLDEAKSEFIGNVSHELRTPLTSLRTSVGNLLDGVVGELSDAQRTTLERADRELVRMSNLVDEMLELARLDAGVVQPRCEDTDLAELARAAAAGLSGARIEVNGAGRAEVDPRMLRRVLVNLLDNALKFGPAGQTVRVEVDGATFRVRDEGPGFADTGLFERFRQGAQQGVKNAGAGIGLAIVQRLVELHGGVLRVLDGPGGAVEVELPERHA